LDVGRSAFDLCGNALADPHLRHAALIREFRCAAIGTFGAFIKLKSLAPDRRASFDVAVAGPLAGLVFAIPALLIGLQQSQIVIGNPPATDMLHTGVQLGSSFLLAILAKIALGADTIQGHQLMLHPLAFAGWLGLFVTALNLLPIGQLDGGHIAHALFGAKRGHAISVGALSTLFALALFVWPGLMMWAFIVWFIAGTRDAPPLNDVTPLDPRRGALGCSHFCSWRRSWFLCRTRFIRRLEFTALISSSTTRAHRQRS
jgi:Zn-dependent protease